MCTPNIAPPAREARHLTLLICDPRTHEPRIALAAARSAPRALPGTAGDVADEESVPRLHGNVIGRRRAHRRAHIAHAVSPLVTQGAFALRAARDGTRATGRRCESITPRIASGIGSCATRVSSASASDCIAPTCFSISAPTSAALSAHRTALHQNASSRLQNRIHRGAAARLPRAFSRRGPGLALHHSGSPAGCADASWQCERSLAF
jgi:hypothetical protein